MSIIKYYEYFSTKPLKIMSKRKIKHSKRVAMLTKELTSNKNIYNAALYHDFLERGGEKKKAKKVLSFYSYKLVEALTIEDGVNIINNFKKKFDIYSEIFKNDVIIIKVCDRIDNLRKRREMKELTEKYLKKSKNLIKFLFKNYSGNKEKMRKFILKYEPSIKNNLEING